MAQDVKMVLKVDLQCSKCYKKVKKVLCKFPVITDQVFDEKANTVTIKVSCCNPEKLRNKIYCKGGKSIKNIEIVKPQEKTKSKDEKSKEPDKTEKTKSKDEQSKEPDKTEKTKKPDPVPVTPVQVYLPIQPYPMGCSCIDCRYGWPPCPPPPPPPPPCYDGYYVCYCGRRRSYYGSRCFCEENPASCTVM